MPPAILNAGIVIPKKLKMNVPATPNVARTQKHVRVATRAVRA
jgi:hypothetical protein